MGPTLLLYFGQVSSWVYGFFLLDILIYWWIYNKMECDSRFKSVNRIEVIDGSGRSYTNLKVKDFILSLQDEGQTLKLFIDERKDSNEKR